MDRSWAARRYLTVRGIEIRRWPLQGRRLVRNVLAVERRLVDHGHSMNFADLVAAVDAAFAFTGRGLLRWADPHQARSPRDEKYSRVTNPAKWRIVGARADAWLVALADT